MNRMQMQTVLQLPEPLRKCSQVIEALKQGVSVVWLFPETVSIEPVISLVRQRCSETMNVDVVTVQRDTPLPGRCLARFLGIEQTHNGIRGDFTAEELMQAAHGYDLIVVRGIDGLDVEGISLWSAFIEDWAEVAKRFQAIDCHLTSLLLVTHCTELAEMLCEDVFLSLHWYWGWIGEPEMLVLAREFTRETRDAGEPISELLWLESAASDLSGTDVEFLYWLLDNARHLVSIDDVFDALSQYGSRKGWAKDWLEPRLRSVERLEGMLMVRGHPPSEVMDLWAKGIVDWHPKYELIVHCAAWALVGERRRVAHLVWRGHARALLPELDDVRLQLCRFVDSRFRGWGAYCRSQAKYQDNRLMEGVQDNPVGEFCDILQFVRSRKTQWSGPSREWWEFLDAVDKLRNIRNDLAHYKPLTRDQFELLFELKRLVRGFMQETRPGVARLG